MLEQTRHFKLAPGDEPVLPVRRISELHVRGLPAIDLVNPLALDLLGLKIDDMRFETQPFCRDQRLVQLAPRTVLEEEHEA